MVKGGETMRVDNELAEMIRDAAEKNEIGIREASKEIARVVKQKIGVSKKVLKEIKF